LNRVAYVGNPGEYWRDFLRLRWNRGLFLKLCWIFLTKIVAEGDLVSRVVRDSLLKLCWNSQSGNPQVSLDMSASRLVLLDRANGDEPVEEEMPF